MNGANILMKSGRPARLGALLLAVSLAACTSAARQGGTGTQGPASGRGTAESASASASPSAAAKPGENGQLGMIFEVNNSGWQKVLNAPAKRGMVIVLAIPNQPGAKAGLTEGDVVSKMNGVEVFNANVTNREIRKLHVGDKVTLDIERKNGPAQVDVTVEPAQQIDLPGMLSDLVKKDPNNARNYFLKGAYGDKDVKAALADYDKAIQLKSDFVSAIVQRGTLQQKDDPGKAMADFNKAISLDPNYEPVYVNRSVLFSSQKAYDKAMQDDQKAVQLDPTDPAALSNLGIGYVNTGDAAKGLDAENKALQLDPLFGPALLYRGLIYRDSSRADLQQAAKLVKDDSLRSLAEDALKKMS